MRSNSTNKRRRERVLALEVLGARVVLSASNPIAGFVEAPAMRMGAYEMRIAPDQPGGFDRRGENSSATEAGQMAHGAVLEGSPGKSLTPERVDLGIAQWDRPLALKLEDLAPVPVFRLFGDFDDRPSGPLGSQRPFVPPSIEEVAEFQHIGKGLRSVTIVNASMARPAAPWTPIAPYLSHPPSGRQSVDEFSDAGVMGDLSSRSEAGGSEGRSISPRPTVRTLLAFTPPLIFGGPRETVADLETRSWLASFKASPTGLGVSGQYVASDATRWRYALAAGEPFPGSTILSTHDADEDDDGGLIELPRQVKKTAKTLEDTDSSSHSQRLKRDTQRVLGRIRQEHVIGARSARQANEFQSKLAGRDPDGESTTTETANLADDPEGGMVELCVSRDSAYVPTQNASTRAQTAAIDSIGSVIVTMDAEIALFRDFELATGAGEEGESRPASSASDAPPDSEPTVTEVNEERPSTASAATLPWVAVLFALIDRKRMRTLSTDRRADTPQLPRFRRMNG